MRKLLTLIWVGNQRENGRKRVPWSPSLSTVVANDSSFGVSYFRASSNGKRYLRQHCRTKDGEAVVRCRYSGGVTPYSPGLPRFAATLGNSRNRATTLKELRHHEQRYGVTPLGYMNECDAIPG